MKRGSLNTVHSKSATTLLQLVLKAQLCHNSQYTDKNCIMKKCIANTRICGLLKKEEQQWKGTQLQCENVRNTLISPCYLWLQFTPGHPGQPSGFLHETPVTACLGARRLRGSSLWAGWQQSLPAAGRGPREAPTAAATATGSAEDLLSHSAALAALPPDSSACKAQGKANYNVRDRYKSKGRIVCTEGINKPGPRKTELHKTPVTWHLISLKKKKERKREKQTQLHTHWENGESSTNRRARHQRLGIRSISLPSPQNSTMCLFLAIQEKSRCVSYTPPTDRWDHPLESLRLSADKSQLHPQEQTPSPSSPESQTKTKKSLLQCTLSDYTSRAKHCSLLPAPILCSLCLEPWPPFTQSQHFWGKPPFSTKVNFHKRSIRFFVQPMVSLTVKTFPIQHSTSSALTVSAICSSPQP